MLQIILSFTITAVTVDNNFLQNCQIVRKNLSILSSLLHTDYSTTEAPIKDELKEDGRSTHALTYKTTVRAGGGGPVLDFSK